MEQEALKLKNEGFTYQEIADQLGISKTGVFRLIKNAKINEPQLSYNSDQENSGHTNSFRNKLELKRLELEHEREMAKIKLQERELELKEQGFIVNETENPQLGSIEMDDEDLAISLLAKRKENLLNRFKELVQSFLDQVKGFKWNEDDITQFINKADQLQNSIEMTSDLVGTDFMELKVYDILELISTKLNNAITELQEEEESLLGFGYLFGDGYVSIPISDEEKVYLESVDDIEDFEEEKEYYDDIEE